MSSNINPYNVDGTFPVAGQDNPSQGFRDNFTNIKNNFIFAENEITDLQSKVIVTQALTGQTISNDMAGTQIRRPQLAAWTQTLIDNGAVSGSATLDFNQANFQKITTAAPISLNFINWPTSTGTGALGYGVMRVWIVVSDVSHTVTLPASVTIGQIDLAGFNPTNNTITFDTPGDYVFDFSSVDGGFDFLIFDLTRNRVQFRDPSFYFNPAVTPTLLIGYNDLTFPTAVALETGTDTISAFGSMNVVTVGNLSLNQVETEFTSNKTPGYTITSARGDATIGLITPVQTGDFLGFMQAYAYSGNITLGNTFNQSAAISYYATGSNVTYGIGGNIGFFTRPDGSATPIVKQALGVENDQSIKAFGNVEVAGKFKTDAGIVEGGTYVTSLATSGYQDFYANTSISTLIIDSLNSATISSANLLLPLNPPDRFKFKIATVAPIAYANVYPGPGINVKYVATNSLNAGNVAINLIYNASNSTWYKA